MVKEKSLAEIEREDNEEFIRDHLRYPAVESNPTNEIYFLKDGKIVEVGTIGSSQGDHVTIYLKKGQAETSYFKDDYAVKLLSHHAPFRFYKVTGEYMPMMSDEPNDRCEGVTIVSRWNFDWGFHSTKRYGAIEGFGKVAENTRRQELSDDD